MSTFFFGLYEISAHYGYEIGIFLGRLNGDDNFDDVLLSNWKIFSSVTT